MFQVDFGLPFKEFKKIALPIYLEREAANAVAIAILNNSMAPEQEKTFCNIVIRNEKEIAAIGMMTPPRPLLIYLKNPEASEVLIDNIHKNFVSYNKIVGESNSVDAFLETFLKRKGTSCHNRMDQGVFRCTKVKEPEKTPGKLIPADSSLEELLADWSNLFDIECNLGSNKELAKKSTKLLISRKEFYVWQLNGIPVSMAVCRGQTPNGLRVGRVYTPKEYRGRGIASNLVAEIAKNVHQKGNKYAFLYTDLSNPTSNKIYQKIGFEKIPSTQAMVDVSFPS